MSDYLVHFNKNHDKKGQFTYGDGDGDGIVDDHANQNKEGAGGKIKKAVAAYDSARDYVRSRQTKEDQYKITKAKTELEKERIENLRNVEQNDIKSRNINTAMLKEQARADRNELRIKSREQRAEELINNARRKTEKDIMRAEAAEAKAKALLAKQELRNMKIAAREEKRAERQQRRDLINQARAAEKAQQKAQKAQQKEIQRYNNDLERQASKYEKKAKHLVARAAAFTLTGAISGAAIDGIRVGYYKGKAADLRNQMI